MASTLRTKSDTVLWALHSFEAENDDELGFNAGERIILLERDDLYGDGWFQVRSLVAEGGRTKLMMRGEGKEIDRGPVSWRGHGRGWRTVAGAQYSPGGPPQSCRAILTTPTHLH